MHVLLTYSAVKRRVSMGSRNLVPAVSPMRASPTFDTEKKRKQNKTPAQAFTPPAEKKIGAKWTFMYNCSGREHEKWLFKKSGYLTSDLTREFFLK